MDVLCELINVPGSPWDNFESRFGWTSGCYCRSYGRLTVHECCLRDGGCTTDLESREHPCNNIEGISEDTYGNPLLPPTEKRNRQSGCIYSNGYKGIIKRILLKTFDTRWGICVFLELST